MRRHPPRLRTSPNRARRRQRRAGEAGSGSGAPAGAQEKPAPAPDAAASQPSAAPADETPHRSLFDQTWHQFQFGGRATSINGDPARFQRYQDVRDGVNFTDARYAAESSEGDWLWRAAADNVGYRDQRYFADYQRTGRFKVTGLWDEIPQFYSVDTATAYTHTGDNLVLDDATQRLIQNGQGNLSSWIPLSPKFELHERRDIGSASLVATPKPQLDLTATYTMNRHVGELPWGASFGFGNDVEVPLPYDSRTNDFNIGAQWNNTRNMLSVAYTGSWFDNLDTPLDLGQSASPGRLDQRSRARADFAVAVELGTDGQHRRLHQVRAPDPAHRVHFVWILEEQRDASAVHDQFRLAAAGAAQADHRG